MPAPSYGAAPVWYGSDRDSVHLGMTRQSVLGPDRPRQVLDNSGLCWRGRSTRYPVTLTLAPGRTVTCGDCLAEANRRTTRKETNR
jgi:hypothetical protein